MTTSGVAANPESTFSLVLATAAGLPGVRIDRADYLRSALARHCSEEQIRVAIDDSPAAAGIPLDLLDRLADDSIRYEAAKASAISAAAGIPGFVFMAATVPADLAQYLGHMLRVAQKLAYLYSWPDLLSGDADDLDDATKGVLTLFVGVMFGAQSANTAVGQVAGMLSKQALKRLPRQALTKGVIYPVVKKVAGYLGARMTTQTFASAVSKAIPVIGAVVSGGITLATFLPMAKKLKSHLSGLELTTSSPRADAPHVVDVDVVDVSETSDHAVRLHGERDAHTGDR
ncbi:hypothetical protein ACIBCR_02385 [Micromonospora echinospora]|uniref:hypothetical protein n=1 Tax=Micromonospora echinospora TaxID=1877 RepID=UPI0037BC18A8